jgi:hypothetical protein
MDNLFLTNYFQRMKTLFLILLFSSSAFAIDKEAVRKAVATHLPEVEKCYADSTKDKNLFGRITFRWDVDDKGQVFNAEVEKDQTTLEDEGTQTCILELSRTWKFPPAKKGKTTVVTYPFVFNKKK